MSAIVISKALSDAQVAAVRKVIAEGPFVAGSHTAVGGASRVKHNLQLAPGSEPSARAAELLVAGLRESSEFQSATWVDAMMTPMFCRYEPGMAYGDHIDGALMGEAPMLVRCDIAVTICLNDGSAYDGGDLVIDSAGVPRRWKGKAGDSIVYPADTLHRVEMVTRGVREVAVFWIQSLIRDPGLRRILFDLRAVLEELDRTSPPGPHIELLRRSYFNLVRMWT
jgi:PKHD-type hydroxylase